MLVELCVGNYATSDGLFNGVDDTFQDNIPLIWIHFHNSQIERNTQLKNFHIYEQFPTIDNKCTPIEQKNTKIQNGSNPSHIITKIQFPIQLDATCIIHWA